MTTKEQKIEIFENTVLGLRKNTLRLQEQIRCERIDRMVEKFRRLTLD